MAYAGTPDGTQLASVIPGYDGDPHKLDDFLRRARGYIAGCKPDERAQCGPRLYVRLTSTAWRSTEHTIRLEDLEVANGGEILLLHLEREFSKLQDTTLFAALDRFFYGSARGSRQSLIEFFVTYREQLRNLELKVTRYMVEDAERLQATAIKEWKENQAEHVATMIDYQQRFMEWSFLRLAAQQAQATFAAPEPARPPALDQRHALAVVAPFSLPSVISGFFVLRRLQLSSVVRASVLRSSQGSLRLDDLEKALRATEPEERPHREGRDRGERGYFGGEADEEFEDGEPDGGDQEEDPDAEGGYYGGDYDDDDDGGYEEDPEAVWYVGSWEQLEGHVNKYVFVAGADATLVRDECEENDEEYEEAYSAYQDARKHLLDLKKARGFTPVPKPTPPLSRSRGRSRGRGKGRFRGKGKGRSSGKGGSGDSGDRPRGRGRGAGKGRGDRVRDGGGRGSSSEEKPWYQQRAFGHLAVAGEPTPSAQDAQLAAAYQATTAEPAVDYGEVAFNFMAVGSVRETYEWIYNDTPELPPSAQPETSAVLLACTPGYAVIDSGCTLSCVGEHSTGGYKDRCHHETGRQPGSASRNVVYEGIGPEKVTSTESLTWPVKLFGRAGHLQTQVVKGSKSPMLISQLALESLGAIINHETHELLVPKLSSSST